MFKFIFFFIENFLIKTFFKKEEYDIKSKHFNVFKIVVFVFLLSSSILSGYFLYKIIIVYNYITNNCPSCIENIN